MRAMTVIDSEYVCVVMEQTSMVCILVWFVGLDRHMTFEGDNFDCHLRFNLLRSEGR